MPTISQFQGIDILMRLNEHRPPHFHAKYGENIAAIRIGTWEYQAGNLPNRVYKLVVKWGKLREQELRDNWSAQNAVNSRTRFKVCEYEKDTDSS